MIEYTIIYNLDGEPAEQIPTSIRKAYELDTINNNFLKAIEREIENIKR